MDARTVLELLIGVSFSVSGAIAWKARPGNRIGPLMVAFGAGQIIGRGLMEAGDPVLSGIGVLIFDGTNVFCFLLLLAFPDGRLRSRRDWLILAPFAVAIVPMEVAWLLFLPENGLPWANGLVVWPSAATADAMDLAQRLLVSAASIALAVALVARWRRATPALRRILVPTLAGAVAVLALSARFLYHEFVGPIPLWYRLLALTVFMGVPVGLLYTLLRARLDRASIGALLVDLGDGRERAQLRDALARALGDPTLEVAYWVPEFSTYVTAEGQRVDVAPGTGSRATTLVERHGVPMAALVHDASLSDQPARLEEVAAAAGIALENARLQAELQARLLELKSSRARAIEAADAERRRLERNLHDGAQGRLVALSLELHRLDSRLAGDAEGRRLLEDAREELAESLQELREIARGLHPAVLEAHGLEIALDSLATGAPLPVKLRVDLPDRLQKPTEVAAFYLVSEALTNTAKYARASSASVDIHRENGHVVVEVTDDGVGGADTAAGSGLRGLADRVEALNGSLRVWSPHGAGTRVRAEIPCE